MYRALLVVSAAALAGCPGAQEPELHCGSAAAADLAPCPPPAALHAHLRNRWTLPAAATISSTCVPGRFGGAAWIIDATVEDGGRSVGATFILQASCGALTESQLRARPPGDARHEAINLDGDGLDEVVTRRSGVEDGGTSVEVEVYRVGGGRLVRGGKVRVAYDGADPTAGALTCDGTVRYVARPNRGFYLDIDAIRSTDSELCLATGHHRFALGAGGLRKE